MIQKLESAGLGYHVTAEETAERLGKNERFRVKDIKKITWSDLFSTFSFLSYR